MSRDLAAPLRLALIANPGLVSILSTWTAEPAVFTRRPAPDGAEYPMAFVSPDIAETEADSLAGARPVVTRDISIYGDNAKHYREVEAAGYLVHEQFHRQRFAIVVPGYSVINILASGPVPAPTDDEKRVGRMVSLTIQLRKLA